MTVDVEKVLVVDVQAGTEEKCYGLKVEVADILFSTKKEAEAVRDRLEQALRN